VPTYLIIPLPVLTMQFMKKLIMPAAIVGLALFASPVAAQGHTQPRIVISSECLERKTDLTAARRVVEVAEASVRHAKKELQRLQNVSSRAAGKLRSANARETNATANMARTTASATAAAARLAAAQTAYDDAQLGSNARLKASTASTLRQATSAVNAANARVAIAQSRLDSATANVVASTNGADAAVAAVDAAVPVLAAASDAVAPARTALAEARADANDACRAFGLRL
jgi:hypothetical protein